MNISLYALFPLASVVTYCNLYCPGVPISTVLFTNSTFTSPFELSSPYTSGNSVNSAFLSASTVFVQYDGWNVGAVVSTTVMNISLYALFPASSSVTYCNLYCPGVPISTVLFIKVAVAFPKLSVGFTSGNSVNSAFLSASIVFVQYDGLRLGAVISYINVLVVSFPAISLTVIVFSPSTKYCLIFWKFASDHAFGVTFINVSFISYSFTK